MLSNFKTWVARVRFLAFPFTNCAIFRRLCILSSLLCKMRIKTTLSSLVGFNGLLELMQKRVTTRVPGFRKISVNVIDIINSFYYEYNTQLWLLF